MAIVYCGSGQNFSLIVIWCFDIWGSKNNGRLYGDRFGAYNAVRVLEQTMPGILVVQNGIRARVNLVRFHLYRFALLWCCIKWTKFNAFRVVANSKTTHCRIFEDAWAECLHKRCFMRTIIWYVAILWKQALPSTSTSKMNEARPRWSWPTLSLKLSATTTFSSTSQWTIPALMRIRTSLPSLLTECPLTSRSSRGSHSPNGLSTTFRLASSSTETRSSTLNELKRQR